MAITKGRNFPSLFKAKNPCALQMERFAANEPRRKAANVMRVTANRF
jgi:hypothetical protein